ncbi:TetR/AcrR family transcriptional regulator [Pantoea sp. CCBC3-3-1]|uniref:TetR/AcrR family transcriptional regulator n=1 Tax=Pantoea sp. CCBC3-3-1 TaxID=2490851 RepID=UPI0011BF4F08|nr:TetR/AcrR family transcriptional regulator [Pantoea sp. CCBC3-3-1]
MNASVTQNTTKERGRPREFDPELAVDKAMLIFRQKGYHAASVADLSEAMNLTAGSIYKAFKDKRSLFLRAFERYISVRNADLRQRMENGADGRERLAEVLKFYLESAHGVEGRRGCLVVGSATELQVLDDELAALVQQAITRNKTHLLSLLSQGQQDGSVSAGLNIETAADVLLSLLFGLRVVGKVGNIADPEAVVAMVLKIVD